MFLTYLKCVKKSLRVLYFMLSFNVETKQIFTILSGVIHQVKIRLTCISRGMKKLEIAEQKKIQPKKMIDVMDVESWLSQIKTFFQVIKN